MTFRGCTFLFTVGLLPAQPLKLEKTIPLNVEGRHRLERMPRAERTRSAVG
jgi:hypothetical protein